MGKYCMKKKIKWSQTVFIADGIVNKNGHKYYINDLTIPKKPVIVTKDFNKEKKLGKAKLSIQGNNVIADITIKMDNPILLHNTIACIKGEITQITKDNVIEGLEISSIGICAGPNADSRIERINISKIL